MRAGEGGGDETFEHVPTLALSLQEENGVFVRQNSSAVEAVVACRVTVRSPRAPQQENGARETRAELRKHELRTPCGCSLEEKNVC